MRGQGTHPDACSQAHQQLLTREERRQWEQGLASARVALSNGGLPHYLLGELDHSESLAGGQSLADGIV